MNSALITMPSTVHRASRLPTGNVTFLFTDIEGSTTLWEQHPDAMQAALARHDTLLRHAIESSDGCIVKSTGDGVYAVFAAAPDALAACLAAQRCLREPEAGASNPTPRATEVRMPLALSVRMGLHTGAAELRDGDYFGAVLNRAARIMSAAHGGQVLLSAATAELVRRHLPEGVTLREMGEHRLKGLLNPERLLQLVASDLRADFPPLASLTGHSLPAERDAFVGRRESLAELARRLDGGARLVSVLGLGGTGKTRLVTRFGWSSLGNFPGGVWFCDLSEARSRGWRLARRCARARRAVGQRRSGGPTWALDRGPWKVPRDPGQLRAGRAPRGGDAGPVAQPRKRCTVPGDNARSAGAIRRRDPRAAARWRRPTRLHCSYAGPRRRSPVSRRASKINRRSPRS